MMVVNSYNFIVIVKLVNQRNNVMRGVFGRLIGFFFVGFGFVEVDSDDDSSDFVIENRQFFCFNGLFQGFLCWDLRLGRLFFGVRSFLFFLDDQEQVSFGWGSSMRGDGSGFSF